MSNIDLTGDIQLAIDGAAERGHTLALGYIDDDGYPATSFRGSTQVHDATHLALWARNKEDGFVKAIADRPKVTLLFFEHGGPGPVFLSIRGEAKADPSINDAVFEKMIQAEKDHGDKEKGVAVLVEVQSVRGARDDGFFEQGG
jgi:general stress protein 26